MQTKKSLQIKENQKDTEKGQKIIGAVYMITAHIKDSDPLKDILRSTALDFVCTEGSDQERSFETLSLLFGGAVIAGVLSEKNSSIIVYEMKKYMEQSRDVFSTNTLSDFFTEEKEQSSVLHFGAQKEGISKGQSKSHYSEKMSFKSNQSLIKDTKYPTSKTSEKEERKQKILQLINDKKSVVIKDITSLFPSVSEKTIQRELTSLIDSGSITKRGNKRWSIYMAVQTLLS